MTYDTISDAVTMRGSVDETLLAGRFRIVRQLGQGGMGSVWLAVDTQLDNKQFAIKMLPSILVSNKRAYRQLKDEALVAMKLVHPNIVQIRAFEENDGNPFLVMDYIDGRTLDDYLAEKGMLTEDEAIRILRPIAAALDYAHTKGVVHRDVKPGNVMIAKDGTPCILDFGIAREIQETMTRVTGKLSSGTLLYMSPEQLNGAAPKSPQDVYSFAAMAYECLKGEPPFVRGQIEHQILNSSPAPLSGNIGIAANIMRGLLKNAGERPQKCSDVLLVNGRQSGAGKTDRGHKRIWVSSVLLLFCVLCITCFYFVQYRLWDDARTFKPKETPEPPQTVSPKSAVSPKPIEVETAPPKPVALPKPIKVEEPKPKPKVEPAAPKAEPPPPKPAASPQPVKVETAPPKPIKVATPESKPKVEPAAPKVEPPKQKPMASPQPVKVEAAKPKPAAPPKPIEVEMPKPKPVVAPGTVANEYNVGRRVHYDILEKERAKKEEEAKALMSRLVREGFILDAGANKYQPGTEKRKMLPNGKALVMVWCPPGWFMMGNRESRYNADDSEFYHAVRLTKGFWIGKYEVTESQWRSVMGESDSFWSSDKPKTEVSFDDCEDFCRRLGARLPSEAEWEYACRSGTQAKYSMGRYSGRVIDRSMANAGVSFWGVEDVGQYEDYANAWGICDMHGNVREWCADIYGLYGNSNAIAVDPLATGVGVHVVRGGACNEDFDRCTSTARSSGKKDQYTGFRICCDDLNNLNLP